MIEYSPFKKVKFDSLDILAEIKWTCPDCGHKNEDSYNPSPYTAIADNGWDCDCKKCKGFFTIKF